MKYSIQLFMIICLCGCASISNQYYYEPSASHQTIKGHLPHADYKMVYSKVSITGKTGDTLGSIVTTNGTGHPLLMGPLLPIFPVGGFFKNSRGQFEMEMSVNCGNINLTPLNEKYCYMIANDTANVPLNVKELVNGNSVHSYSFYCDTRFSKIKTLKIVTGNPMLDSALKNITFNRRSRIKFDFIGPGY